MQEFIIYIFITVEFPSAAQFLVGVVDKAETEGFY